MNSVDDLMSYSDGDLREWIKSVVFESETDPIHIDSQSSSRVGAEIGDILWRHQDLLIRVFQWLCEDLCEYFKTWPEGNRSFSQDATLEDNLVLSLILGHMVEELPDPIKSGNPTDQVAREIWSLLDDKKRISMCKEPISIQQRCLEALGVLGPIGDLPKWELAWQAYFHAKAGDHPGEGWAIGEVVEKGSPSFREALDKCIAEVGVTNVRQVNRAYNPHTGQKITSLVTIFVRKEP